MTDDNWDGLDDEIKDESPLDVWDYPWISTPDEIDNWD